MTARHPSASATAGISARIDRLPPTPYLWRLVALVSFGAFFEIYDLALSAPLGLGLTAAHIFRPSGHGLFGLNDQATFIAATFAGLYLGTVAFSHIADRFGRRPVFTIALVWYALATVVMGFQNSAGAIDLWRFISSIGLGLELVTIDCYLAELTPKAVRGKAFAFSTSIQFLSTPLAAVLAWRLIPGDHFGIAGWRWLAFLPAIGAVLVWVVRRALPESPRWLESHGRAEEADRILSAIEARIARESGAPLPPPQAEAAPLPTPKDVSLFQPPYRRRTVAMVIFHTFQTIGYFGFSNWLPTLLVSQGVTISKSLGYSAVLTLIPPLAPLVFTRFADKAERKWMIVAGALLAAACGLGMSRMTQHSNIVLFTAIGAGVALGSSLMSFAYHTYQSELFPTPIRARGVGFVYSFSRLSAIFSGYIVAFTLTRAGSAGVFAVISGAMVVVALSIGLLGPRTRGLSLEEI